MIIKSNTEKTITCESDPCEQKTRFVIDAPNFRDLEAANDAAGDILPYELGIAKRQADFEAQKASGKIPAESEFKTTDEEQAALFKLSRWVRDRNTALVLHCLRGADDLRFKNPMEVENFLLGLSPVDAVRDVIDELAAEIFKLQTESKKNSL